MRRSHILIAAAAVLVVLVCAGSVFAYDSSRDDKIANGVRVGIVDVGGLSAAAARDKLRAALLAKLQRPLVVVAGETRFPLTAREAHIAADIDMIVADAVRAGREGSILTRTWRGLTGGEVDATITPQVTYSRPAVQRLVDKVRVKMSRKPVDAGISVAGQTVEVRRSKAGLAVDPRRLRAKVEHALVTDIVGERAVRADLTRPKPKVTTQRLASKYPVVLAVDRSHFRISLFKKLKKVKTYPIAVGQIGLETPAGRYTITNKAVNPAWHVPNSPWAGSLAGTVIPGGAPNNPLKARWLGVYDGVGVHGTDARYSIGSNASHGCIRMLVEDVIKLYDQVPVGTPIYIN
ncbi:MAG: L,D-transpeptidase ErfK/SrfK [Solirubrobacteraceae bacterium]|jgi:lipoprotein-anchoring transpeptidase ErfK/SrfK|nr:L,D-transpeptidase ErfK/SrfK [Solirubrobacteraceae bacterium]